MRVCAYSAVCEEDAHWIPQYLAEAERLSMPFAMLLDRCSQDTARKVAYHPLCEGTAVRNESDGEFTEDVKQAVFDIVVRGRFHWAMAWDVDETYERAAPEKIKAIMASGADYVDIIWKNLWGDKDHVRIDGPLAGGHRVKFYNLKHHWRFTHTITNGPKMVSLKNGAVSNNNPAVERSYRHDLVCLHWGLMTRELRILHKDRWDRIYTKAVGANPYGIWNYVLDEENYPPVVVPHSYF